MNRFLIHLELEAYLRQWLIHDSGGQQPIRFKKLSIENKILLSGLIQQREGVAPSMPGADTVAIEIPCFREKPPSTYNYLPRKAMHELKKVIRNRFQITFWSDIHQARYIGKRRDNLILAWMTSNGIEQTDTNYNTLAKMYQRQSGIYRKQKKDENPGKSN